MPATVVLDASMLLLPFERQVRLEAEFDRLFGSWRALVPESVLAELAVMAAQAKGRRRMHAKAALSLASRFEFVATDRPADGGVMQAAQALEAAVATTDMGLRRQALGAGLPAVYLRGLDHLELETP